MFRIPVNTSGVTLIAGGPAEAVLKNRSTGEIATDRQGRSTYVVHVTAFVPGDSKPQVWSVKVPGPVKPVVQGQMVQVDGLVASDWESEQDGRSRHGVSFRAESILAVQTKAA
jgi:hypothetical protein